MTLSINLVNESANDLYIAQLNSLPGTTITGLEQGQGITHGQQVKFTLSRNQEPTRTPDLGFFLTFDAPFGFNFIYESETDYQLIVQNKQIFEARLEHGAGNHFFIIVTRRT